MSVRLELGDCVEVMKTLGDASVDAVVTDPPYEIGFMAKGWDGTGIAYSVEMWREVLRVLKPGGHVLAFGGTRTYHRMACAIEDAGFEIRDSIHWIYGSGFPKSLDVSKAIDKAAGAERSIIAEWENRASFDENGEGGGGFQRGTIQITAPATDAAKQWNGWGTALKPAHEPVVVARKPLVGTVAANVQAHGTGAMNIDACRVGTAGGTRRDGRADEPNDAGWAGMRGHGVEELDAGRWPPNILLSHTPDCGEACAENCSVTEMDRQSGGASRFFPVFRYQAKASRSERGTDNKHPTVKPVAMMRWLVRLVTPPGGVVLEPFMGSGTTGVACVQENLSFVGIEREPQYFEICKARIAAAQNKEPTQREMFA